MKLYQYNDKEEDGSCAFFFYLSIFNEQKYTVKFAEYGRNLNSFISYDGNYCWCERYSEIYNFIAEV